MAVFEYVIWVYILFECILIVFLTLPVVGVLVTLFKKITLHPKTTRQTDFACVITSYGDTGITVHLVKSLLQQTHPAYHIYLIADNSPAEVYPVADARLHVYYPSQPFHSKSKSIWQALQNFVRPHDAVVIFDPDNLASPHCLAVFNRYFRAGYKAIQGKRTAKNLDSVYACLDALSEFYYNHTQRYVPFHLGSSATIAGSGMALNTALYKEFFLDEIIPRQHEVIVAEDKMLQMYIVAEKRQVIAYAPEAIVYDEKVSDGEQVKRQRTRWINSFFLHFGQAINLCVKGLIRFDFNQSVFGFILSIPPMFLLGLVSVVCLLPSFLVSVHHGMALLAAISLFGLTLLVSLQLAGAPRAVFRAVTNIPLFISQQLQALLKIKSSNSDFMVTEKTKHVRVEDVMNDKSAR